MSCFPCFRNGNGVSCNKRDGIPLTAQHVLEPTIPDTTEKEKPAEDTDNISNMDVTDHVDTGDINAKQFTFRELAKATNNFRQQFLIGEGGFGRVYKGTLKNTGEVVAVKQLDKNGIKDQKEFIVEVLVLSLLRHKNLAHLVGYCADGDQRLLVYEFVPGGSLDQQIHDIEPEKGALDWDARIEIAYGVAQGLEYLHDKANPPIVYRDLKSSNILLDNDLNPKLSDFGLANLGTKGLDHMKSSSRIIGTFGYSAPEYTSTGQVTLKSDVFSFGVVLLEIITGRRAIDTTKPNDQQNLVSWAHPFFKDPKRFPELADPLLEGKFPERSLNQVVAIAAMCLQEEAAARPFMSDIVTTLSFLSVKEVSPTASPTSPESSEDDKEKRRGPVQVGRIHCSGSSYSNEPTSMRSRRNVSLNRKSSAGEGSSGSKYHSSKFHDGSDSDGSDDHESPNQQQDMT